MLQHIELGKSHVGFKQVYEGMFEGDEKALILLKQYLEGPVCDPAHDSDNDGMTLLHQAAARSCCVCAKILIIAGTPVSKPNNFGDFAYDYAKAYGEMSEISNVLTTTNASDPSPARALEVLNAELRGDADEFSGELTTDAVAMKKILLSAFGVKVGYRLRTHL